MKVKTSELTGAPLDWAVAKSNGASVYFLEDFKAGEHRQFKPSTDWSQGGPIIEREKVSLHFCCDLRDRNGKYVHATMNTNMFHGYCKGHSTPLIAAMRCYVASKLGDEVEIPEELI